MAKLVSKVYGDALFSLALEKGEQDELCEEATLVMQVIEENRDFLSVICHPEMTHEKKIGMLEDVFAGKVSEDMMGLFSIMVKKGRIGEIESVLQYFIDAVKEYQGIGTAIVTTPMPLSDGQKDQIKNKLLEVSKYQTLCMDYHVDESLLGGIVIRIGDQILDNSIRSKLDAMSRQLGKVKLS